MLQVPKVRSTAYALINYPYDGFTAISTHDVHMIPSDLQHVGARSCKKLLIINDT
jgi:hypothetical protein